MSVDHTPLLRCFIGLVCFTSFCGASQHGAEPINNPMSSQRLAVVVPCYRGDLYRTVASLERWPTECSPVTLKNTDLVLYYAEGEKDNQAVTSAVSTISAKAGQCFAKTRIVYANIDIEDDVYPNGPSAMFYKMYLDEDVGPHFIEYDALAIIEWDVLVASERSFEQLYHSAFQDMQGFWVKGSRMEGADFHSNADIKEMWKVLGHINGNAIYINNDPEFVEYVRYTHTRWELKYPYDVALWLTVSDFPYSWPLWQRYSGKFVTTNLISNVGREHVNDKLVSDALELETLFIHGSHIDAGNMASIEYMKNNQRDIIETENVPARGRKLQPWRENQKWRRVRKWQTTGKWQTIEKWTTLEKWRPDYGTEEISGCLSGCTFITSDETRGRECDLTCETGVPHGTLGCGARDGRFGDNCRTCYYSVDVAQSQDTPDNRAIMCDTLDPVPSVYIRSLSFLRGNGNDVDLARDLRHIIRQKPEDRANDTDLAALFKDASKQPFGRDLVSGSLCAFITARSDDVRQVEVTVISILQFVPGIRVAVAVEENGFDALNSATGIYPSVTVHSTPNASMASLFADDFCGAGTSLVFYVKPASVLSRAFTAKDTHSPVGDLLVVYSNSPSCYSESTMVHQTNAILGFEAPTFICGTDLILPVGANAELRDLLASPIEIRTGQSYEIVTATRRKLEEVDDIFAIPQMLAAIVYEKKTPGIWFINPNGWVSEHLFKTVSIWEIPLVKPLFSCTFSEIQGVDDVAGVMRRNLDFFSQGGTCENGKMVHIL